MSEKACTGCATKPRYSRTIRESEVIETDDREWTIRHLINSTRFGVDRRLYKIRDIRAWVSDYMVNPVVLHQHGDDLARGGLPIGTNLDLRQTERGVMVTTKIAGDVKEDDFARLVYGLHKGGYLRAWSTGSLDEDFEEQEIPTDQTYAKKSANDRQFGIVIYGGSLREYSSVGLPADPGAIDIMVRSLPETSPRVTGYGTLESALRSVGAMLRDAKGLPRNGAEIGQALRELIEATKADLRAVLADPPCQGCIDRQRSIVLHARERAILHAALIDLAKRRGAN